MAVLTSFLLILTGFTGIHSITTVSEVSVKAGESMSIPCLYESKYRNHVKYLCKGYSWMSCSSVIRTNQSHSEKFSISDDKNQRVFTVTIKDLTDDDTDYWCNVEIENGPDEGVYFHMSITRGIPHLRVDNQEITAFNGEDMTISCYYHDSGEMKWCRLGVSCVAGSSGTIDGTRVTIDTRVPNVFTVTMSELTTENSGWYWCVNGDSQMPVHVMVIEKPTTKTSYLTTLSPTPDPHVTSDLTSGLKSFIIPLGLLILAVMVTLFIWFLLRRHKQTKVESSATAMAEEEIRYSSVKKNRNISRQAKEEVTNSDVQHVRKSLGERSNAEMKSDVDVTYSSVVIVQLPTEQKVETKFEDVTYSTLAQQH